MRVLYVAHGRAGKEVLVLLRGPLGVRDENILVFSYEAPENRAWLSSISSQQISVDSIKTAASFERIREFRPDVIVSMHARELIPQQVLDLAPLGGFNLHPSLLPKYRGCFSGVWAIIQQERETGISYHYMNSKFDDGKLILQAKTQVAPDETGYSIFEKLIDLGVSRFEEAFRKVTQDRVPGDAQVGKSSYFGRELPFGGRIDPTWSDQQIDALIRALSFPGKKGAVVLTRGGEREVKSFDDWLRLKKAGEL